jgi:hypothetical protein
MDKNMGKKWNKSVYFTAVGGTKTVNFVYRWGYGLNGLGFEFRKGQQFFPSVNCVDQFWGQTIHRYEKAERPFGECRWELENDVLE